MWVGTVSKFYGWDSQHWRGLGWGELCAWVRAMNHMNRQGEPDPDRWTGPSRDNFADLHAQREKLRGR